MLCTFTSVKILWVTIDCGPSPLHFACIQSTGGCPFAGIYGPSLQGFHEQVANGWMLGEKNLVPPDPPPTRGNSATGSLHTDGGGLP